jgi:cell division transport system permease protein
MTLLLLLTGIVGMLGLAAKNLAQAEAKDASVLHVYLRDDAKQEDVDSLHARLQFDPRVKSVLYVSKADALTRAQRRPGLPDLAQASDTNPFPASLDVQVGRVQDVGPIDAMIHHDVAVDPLFPTSYNKDAYDKIQHLMLAMALGGLAFMALLGFIAVTVTANSIRAAILARHDEVSIMQLVGAPRWMVRGPFLLEGALTGGVAGACAAVVTLILTFLALQAGAGSFAQVAPGVTIQAGFVAAGLLLAAGLALGSGSSLIGIRRHLES